jgi:Arc/MetJ family transcription regulator
MGRTNIDTDDQLLDVVMRRYGVLTKTAAVDLALRRLAGEPSTIDEALELRSARLIGSIPDDPTP